MYLIIVDVLNHDKTMLNQLQPSKPIAEAVETEIMLNIDFYTIESEYNTNIIYLNNRYTAIILDLYEGQPTLEAIESDITWKASASVNIDAFASIFYMDVL